MIDTLLRHFRSIGGSQDMLVHSGPVLSSPHICCLPTSTRELTDAHLPSRCHAHIDLLKRRLGSRRDRWPEMCAPAPRPSDCPTSMAHSPKPAHGKRRAFRTGNACVESEWLR